MRGAARARPRVEARPAAAGGLHRPSVVPRGVRNRGNGGAEKRRGASARTAESRRRADSATAGVFFFGGARRRRRRRHQGRSEGTEGPSCRETRRRGALGRDAATFAREAGGTGSLAETRRLAWSATASEPRSCGRDAPVHRGARAQEGKGAGARRSRARAGRTRPPTTARGARRRCRAAARGPSRRRRARCPAPARRRRPPRNVARSVRRARSGSGGTASKPGAPRPQTRGGNPADGFHLTEAVAKVPKARRRRQQHAARLEEAADARGASVARRCARKRRGALALASEAPRLAPVHAQSLSPLPRLGRRRACRPAPLLRRRRRRRRRALRPSARFVFWRDDCFFEQRRGVSASAASARRSPPYTERALGTAGELHALGREPRPPPDWGDAPARALVEARADESPAGIG